MMGKSIVKSVKPENGSRPRVRRLDYMKFSLFKPQIPSSESWLFCLSNSSLNLCEIGIG
jgi:hypothetical protein